MWELAPLISKSAMNAVTFRYSTTRCAGSGSASSDVRCRWPSARGSRWSTCCTLTASSPTRRWTRSSSLGPSRASCSAPSRRRWSWWCAPVPCGRRTRRLARRRLMRAVLCAALEAAGAGQGRGQGLQGQPRLLPPALRERGRARPLPCAPSACALVRIPPACRP